jgi:hypothetical protein
MTTWCLMRNPQTHCHMLLGGATMARRFDIGPASGAERAALRSSNLRSRKRSTLRIEGPSIARLESTLVDLAAPPGASASMYLP